MAAKVYSLGEECPVPSFNSKNWQADDEKYIKDVEAFVRKQGYNDAFTGKIIKFPVADGYAEYMVATIKPLVLIHLQHGDAWSFQYAHLLTATEVKKKIANDAAFDKIFANR
jgi:hypothetical protein